MSNSVNPFPDPPRNEFWHIDQGLSMCRFEPCHRSYDLSALNEHTMTNKYALPIVIAGSVMLAGCFDGSSSSSDPEPVTNQVRVVHGVSDAPAINVGIVW